MKALACCLAFVLCACNANHKRQIAVVPKATSHLFWQSIQAGAIAASRDFKVEILWNGPATETDYARQVQIVDSMIARHVDGIAVAAQDRDTLTASLDRAAAAHIPVTVFDSGVSSQNYMTFVATNNYQGGQMAARKLADLIGRKGKIAMVMHAPGSVSTGDRERGFEDTIAGEFRNIKIVARQFGMSDRSKAMGAAENMLTAHPDLDGMFASSEPSSMGAALSLKSRGLSGKVKFVAFDAADTLVADLKGGTIDALVAQDPFKIGYEAVRSLVEKLDGKTPPRHMDLSAVVITRDDLAKPEIKALLFPDLQKYLN